MESFEILQEIPPLVLKNLNDRSYEKQKAAGSEIESIVRQINVRKDGFVILQATGDSERIQKILNVLSREVNETGNSYVKKGGLIGLASCGIGLRDDVVEYIPMLLSPVLSCISDNDASIRFYACESLYNIVKASRGNILNFINEIFPVLCNLYIDVDVEVKDISFTICESFFTIVSFTPVRRIPS